ncbi:MAG: hypothetical protein QY306_17980 [Anaerolineales bacterium]|nr:MAG: hypothetical protein QY306_17980 [Anaerolineales bacterium]
MKTGWQYPRDYIKPATLILLLLTFFMPIPKIIYAQQVAPTLTPPPITSPTPELSSNLERRLYQIEIAQSQTIESLKSTNDYNRFLFSVTGAIIALLVGIQSFATLTQIKREGKRDFAESAGVKQVSDILQVVEQSLQSRLAAEEEARKKAIEAEGKLAEVEKKYERLDIFYRNFQSNIRKLRNELESDALLWAGTVPRHGFKGLADKLNDFANRFDRFKIDSEPIEEEKQEFSPHALYIRGIAGHYANKPEDAEKYLKKVVSYQQPEEGEDQLPYNRRIANAYYYLGLIDSNFGHNQDAIDNFENANRRDLQGRDFLTKVVIAEAYMMAGDFDNAGRFLTDLERKIVELQQIEGTLHPAESRLWSRAILIKANMILIKREENWTDKIQAMLLPVRDRDSSYYFATATLAQSYHVQGNFELAKQFFQEVYDTILALADINSIREVRSKILLLLFAGMSSKYIGREKQSAEYLDQANQYCNDLPKINSHSCTVFSPLSKRNEKISEIQSHIALIRKGIVLL